MKVEVLIDNLKCEGCENSIKKGLKEFSQVSEVKIDREKEAVEVEFSEGLSLAEIKTKLASMGYPEKDTLSGFSKLAANAKSYVSCAIGRVSSEEE